MTLLEESTEIEEEVMVVKRKSTESENQINILLADDDEVLLSVISEILKEEKFSVNTYSNGKLANDEFSSRPHHYDIALLDAVMQFMPESKPFVRFVN